MKSAAIVLAALLVPVPAHAQLGGLMKKVEKAQDAKKKYDDLNITESEERQLGEQVSKKLTDKYGVVQDEKLTKYVSLLGTLLAQSTPRANLDWKFIVLDTDGVNAFAAPGGIVHITRGLLGLARNEAELAGVLGHEITHVTEKHTVNAIRKQKATEMGTTAYKSGGGLTEKAIARLADAGYEMVLDNKFSRSDEGEADQKGVRLASKLGYAPSGLADVLKKLDARNTDRDGQNGLFASHPDTRDRIAKIEKQIKDEKLGGTAVVAARYHEFVPFEAKPVTELATSTEGAAGLAGGKSSAAPAKEEPKKKGGLLGKFTTSSSEQKQSNQTIASAGARGVGPDRDAKGGPNKNPVNVVITRADLDAFRKGIAG